MTYRFTAACATLRRDPGHLRLRDRAVLRILNRAQAATAAQLTVLAYGNRRLAQRHLRRLWDWGFVDRLPLPPAGPRGGPAFAYRLSHAYLRRLGYWRRTWRGPGYLAHSLHAVDAVCALVRSGQTDKHPVVQLWFPESIANDVLPGGVAPDAIVVLARETGSAAVCLEIDEGTQHVAPIRDKLRAYRRALSARPGWHVLFVIPTSARRAWLRRVAPAIDVEGVPLWAVLDTDLIASGIDATLTPVARTAEALPLREILTDPRPRRSAAAVASRPWLELLGSGGSEGREVILV